MPYSIRKVDGKFYVYDSKGRRRNKKGYATRAEAIKFQRALYANSKDV